MKKTIILFSLLITFLSAHADDITAVKGLVHRLFPGYEQVFTFRKTTSKVDVFSLRSKDGKIIVSGNNANSMAVGLNHYMKYYCHVDVGWLKSDTYRLPATPPRIPKPVTIKARVKNRFFLNYCTYGYTMPWWKWGEWEHFIDWMALNGINLPLAITGQESIWYKVWSELGLNDYACRTWAGMVRTFYGKRWRMFFDAVEAAVKARQPFDKAHHSSYKDRVCTYEKYWWEGCEGNFKARPTGDSKTIVKEIVAKYKHDIATR
jgi:hypothetical protein